MAPERGAKRKRATYSGEEGSRPSPYRPGSTNLAQHSYGQPQHHGYGDSRGRGGPRGRGRGRGGGPRSMDNTNGTFNQRRFSGANQSGSRPQSQQSQTHAETTVRQEAQSTPQAPVEPVPPPTPVDPYVAASSISFPEPQNPPAFYAYEFLTDDIARTWKEGGRESLLEKVTYLRKNTVDDELSTLWQELLRAGLDGLVPPADIGAFLKEALAVETDSDEMGQSGDTNSPESDILDLVSLLNDEDKKNTRLAAILFVSEISQAIMTEQLDADVLIALNLVRPTFDRAFIRHQTNALYRQSNYNLLREETEGYSKLMTELFTTSANEMPSAEVVKSTFERVRSMIGTFDLDVGRVLDVTLDVFAAVLVREYRFFVKFLRCSSWWPNEYADPNRVPELPHWALPEANGVEALKETQRATLADARLLRDTRFWEYARQLVAEGKGIQAFFQLRNVQSAFATSNLSDSADPNSWKTITGTDPPVGNKTAAQILGFKLRFYSSKARNPDEELPNNLVHLAALLIKIGFISLQDLYSHLWPEDDNMEATKAQKTKEHEGRIAAAKPGGGKNALMMAGALSDDTLPPVSRVKEAEAKSAAKQESSGEAGKTRPEDDLPEPKDTKISLLKALLAIGAIPEALFMLGRFPWLVQLVPELPDFVHRLLNYSVSELYEPLHPLQNIPGLGEPAQVADTDQSGMSKGSLRRMIQPEARTKYWTNLDKYLPDENLQYRYYWEQWNDNMPVCRSVDDLFTLCDTFMNLSGVKIGRDPVLISRLLRIGIHSLETDTSDFNKQRWIDLCKKLLVPSLSLTGHNSAVVSEAYDMLKRFSQATRYSIYSEWYMGQTSRLDDMREAFAISTAETKDILKKISKTNVKPMARALAKAATSSPGIVFQVAIAQMENYSNLVEVVVECARYFTALGYDVLTWSTLNALGRQGRNRVSADGMFASKWLMALSSFFGRVYWRYSMMNLSPTLQYLANQLWQGNPDDLKVFEDLLLNMGGIRSNNTLNDIQIVSMAGGPTIQKEVLLSLQDNRHASRATGRRLMRALMETRLVGPFVVAIAHERQTQLFKLGDNQAPLKLLGNAFDEMHDILGQYLEYLREYLIPEDFDRWVPALHSLIGEYGIEPRIAFWICRPSIVAKMEEWDKSQAEKKAKALQASSSGGAESEVAEAPGDTDMTDAVAVQESSNADTSTLKITPWHPILQQTMDDSRSALASASMEVVGELFYMTFWQLAHGDLYVPQESYKAEEARINQKLKAISQDRSDQSLAGTRKRQAERVQFNSLKEQLQSELKDQVSAYARFTRVRVAKEKEHWFEHAAGKHVALNSALLEECFIPRMVMSQVDAYFCFRMLKLLHSNGARNFRTMGFLDQFFNQQRLAMLIFICTSKEAENLAIFINEVLRDLGRWHAKKETYENEAWGTQKNLPGFCMKVGEEKSEYVFMNYEDEFRRLLYKWHGQLSNAVRQCLEGGEYMHIRNAITVLRGIVAIFPVVDTQAKKLLETVTELGKKETRDDLQLAARSLQGALTRRERNNEWVPVAQFYATKHTSGATPVPTSSAGAKLNAEARDFRPTKLNGVSKTVAEEEDGEINSPTIAEAAKSGRNKNIGIRTASDPDTAVSDPASRNSIPDRRMASAENPAHDTVSKHPPARSDVRDEGRPSPAPIARGDSIRAANGPQRQPHDAPARPDNLPSSGRRSDRGHHREDRGYRESRGPRDDREAVQFDSGRGSYPSEHSTRIAERGPERASDRLPTQERDRLEGGRRADGPGSRHQVLDERSVRSSSRPDRLDRDSPRDHGRETRSREEPSRDRPTQRTMPPPASVVNPERARLIQDDQPSPARDDRLGRDSSRSSSQRNSRANSPIRRDDREHRGAHPEDRGYPVDPRNDRPYSDDRRLTGSRTEVYQSGHDDRARTHPRSVHVSAEAYDARRSREYGPPPGESSYGRLNGPEAPTGPRATGNTSSSRSLRAPSGPAVTTSAAPERGSERQAPSGPAAGRTASRLATGPQVRQGPDSAPSTPVAETSGTGVHPDRARMLNGPGPVGSGSSNSAPRGPAPIAPAAPARPGISTPQSGPSTPVYDRAPRGSDKRFANINNTLQQTGGSQSRPDQGTSIRGRGNRNQPQSPLGPGPPPPSGPGRHDGGPIREPMPDQADLFASHQGMSRRNGPSEGGEHQSRRSGRSPSPGRRGPPPHQAASQDRPPPRRMDSMPDRDRRAQRDDYGPGPGSGSGHSSGRHGGDRRDVREVQWGGDRPPAPEGPGSGRKRTGGEPEDYRDMKRNRRTQAPGPGPGSGHR